MGGLEKLKIYILCRKFKKYTFLADKYRMYIEFSTDICGIPYLLTDIYRPSFLKNKTFLVSNLCFNGQI